MKESYKSDQIRTLKYTTIFKKLLGFCLNFSYFFVTVAHESTYSLKRKLSQKFFGICQSFPITKVSFLTDYNTFDWRLIGLRFESQKGHMI